jgi:hypothetical protein
MLVHNLTVLHRIIPAQCKYIPDERKYLSFPIQHNMLAYQQTMDGRGYSHGVLIVGTDQLGVVADGVVTDEGVVTDDGIPPVGGIACSRR